MKKNITIGIITIVSLFLLLLMSNGNFRYKLKKYTSGVVINFLHSDIFSEPEYKLSEYSEAQLNQMFEGVEPYTLELPPIPDEKLNNSTLLGVDSNNNGVRDDLEIWIVEHFGRDKMLVESFFAYVRSNALNKIIQRDGLFTNELYENDINIRSTFATECRGDYFYNSKYGFYSTQLYTVSKYFMKLVNNTKIRKENAKKFLSNLNNQFFTTRSISEEECKEFFKETKTYKIY